MDFSLMVAFALVWPALGAVALGTGAYLARRYVRAIERRGANDAEITELRQRLAVLEENADATRRDVDRLEAGQEFTTKLLAERVTAPSGGALSPSRTARLP
jgi:hypothetical protein